MGLVFSNKWVMKTYDFHYPLFLTFLQLIISEIFIVITGVLSVYVGGPFAVFAPLEWDWAIASHVFPLSAVWLIMMAASNICLRYSEITFYQVVRALTIIWSLLMQCYYFPEFVVGRWRVVACLVVIVGFCIGSYGEINFNWIGLYSGLISSILVAYYNTLIKKVLRQVNGNSWRLIWYNTTIAIPIFIPVLFLADEWIVNDEKLLPKFLSSNVFWGSLASGVLGYLINLAIFFQIQLTSPLTATISGTVKSALQVALGWLIFRNEVSNLNLLGIVLVITGSTYYSWLSYQYLNPLHAKSNSNHSSRQENHLSQRLSSSDPSANKKGRGREIFHHVNKQQTGKRDEK